MLVVSWMSSKLITVDAEDDFAKALQIMKDYHVSHLPVLDGGRLVGMLSGMTLNDAILAGQARGVDVKGLGLFKVREVMTPNPPSINLCHTVEEAALLMLEKGLTGLPVQGEDGSLMAVITASDIMRAMISLSGVSQGGVLFGLNIPDQPGSIREVVDPLRSAGARLASILTSYDRCAQGRRNVFIRAAGLDRKKLVELKEQLSKVGEIIYILDSKDDGVSEFVKTCLET